MNKRESFSTHCTRDIWSWGSLLVASGLSLLLACGNNPPFPSYDPPPTFAFEYVLSATNSILVPDFVGSSLQGHYTGVPIAGTSFQPTGNVYGFGPAYVYFGSWYTVQGAYWPAVWNIGSVSDCGAGTSSNFNVVQKTFQVSCVPKLLDPTVNPTSYNSSTATLLKVTFNVSIPAGTVATYRFVDAGSGIIESNYQVTFTGSSSMSVEGPNGVPDGGHYLTFDFADNNYHPGGYDAMYVEVTTHGNSCTPTPNHQCP